MGKIPKIFKVRQKARAPKLKDVGRNLTRKLEGFEPIRNIRQGERVGLTAAAFETSGVLNAEDLRLVWIKNTLELEYLFAS